MAINMIEKPGQKLLEVHLTGKLTGADYKQFVPQTERFFSAGGKVNVLVLMHDFHGWSMGGVWQDIVWDFKHFRDIDRLALVGEARWQEMMSKVCKPFTQGEVRYFDSRDLPKAREWVENAVEPVSA
jgi:hypothetical protein